MWFDSTSAPNWSDYLGLLLGVVGFIIAFVQLRKTRNATFAAVTALDEARSKMVRNEILRLDSSFQAAHDDLEHAAVDDNRLLAQRTLIRFGRIAKESAVLLRSISSEHEKLAKQMVRSSVSASRAKELVLLAPPNETIRELLSSEIRSIETLVADVSAVTMSLKNSVK